MEYYTRKKKTGPITAPPLNMNESFKNHTISQRSKIQSIFRMNLTAEKKKKRTENRKKTGNPNNVV